MALNLDAIRKRVAELSGQRKNSNVQFWKPGPGTYKVRGIPWKNAPEGQPFIERWFYYIGEERGILTPNQFGKPDPIQNLIRKLFNTRDPNDKALAKKLLPKMRAYMAVLVRGHEDDGIQVFSFGKLIYQKLLGYYLNEEVGDIMDPIDGFDIEVTITQQPGKQFLDTSVEAARRPRKLSDDPEQIKKWLDAVPNLDDVFRLKEPAEIEAILNSWLEGGVPDTSTDGTSRGGDTKADDEFEKFADLAKKPVEKVAEAPVAEKPVAEKPKKSKKVSGSDDDAVVPNTNLDAAFADLMNE
jgi:hypothetical protein